VVAPAETAADPEAAATAAVAAVGVEAVVVVLTLRREGGRNGRRKRDV